MPLCNDCKKEIEPNKIQISEFLIVDLCRACLSKKDLIKLSQFSFNKGKFQGKCMICNNKTKETGKIREGEGEPIETVWLCDICRDKMRY